MFGALGNVGTMRAFLTLDYNQYSAALRTSSKLTKQSVQENMMLMQRMQKYHSRLGMGATMLTAFVGPITMMVNRMQKEYAEYDKISRKIVTVSGRTAKEIAAMNKDLVKQGISLGASPTSLSRAAYTAAQATFTRPGQMSNIARKSAELSLASGWEITTEKAADNITQMMQAFGLGTEKIGKINDVLLKTRDIGKMEVGDLASAVGNVSAVYANAFPQDKWKAFKEMMAFMASGTTGGLKANTMSYALRNILMRTYDASRKEGSDLNRLAQERGYANASDLMSGGLFQMLEAVHDKTKGYMPFVSALGYKQREIAGMATLLRQGMAFSRMAANELGLNDDRKTDGVSTRYQEEMKLSWQYAIDRLKAVREAFNLSFGPILVKYLSAAASALEKFFLMMERMPDATRHFIVWAGILVTIKSALMTISALMGIISQRAGAFGLLGFGRGSVAAKAMEIAQVAAYASDLPKGFGIKGGTASGGPAPFKMRPTGWAVTDTSQLSKQNYVYAFGRKVKNWRVPPTITGYRGNSDVQWDERTGRFFNKKTGKFVSPKSSAFGEYTTRRATTLDRFGNEVRGYGSPVPTNSKMMPFFINPAKATGPIFSTVTKFGLIFGAIVATIQTAPAVFRGFFDGINSIIEAFTGLKNLFTNQLVKDVFGNVLSSVVVGFGTVAAIIVDVIKWVSTGLFGLGLLLFKLPSAISAFLHPKQEWKRVEYKSGDRASIIAAYGGVDKVPRHVWEENPSQHGTWKADYIKSGMSRSASFAAAMKEPLDVASKMMENFHKDSYLTSLLGRNDIPFTEHPINKILQGLFHFNYAEPEKGSAYDDDYKNRPTNENPDEVLPNMFQAVREYANAMTFGSAAAWNARLPEYTVELKVQTEIMRRQERQGELTNELLGNIYEQGSEDYSDQDVYPDTGL